MKRLNFISLVTLLAIISTTVVAADRTSSQTGNWNLTSTWGGLSVPVDGDSVTIADGHTVTVTATHACAAVLISTTATFATLEIATGQQLTVSGKIYINTTGAGESRLHLLGAASTVDCNDDIQINGDGANPDLSRIVMLTGASQIDLAGSIILANVGEIFGNTASIINMDGSGAQTLTLGSSLIYSNVYLNNSGTGVTLGAEVTDANITGDIEIQSGIFDNGGFAMTEASGDSLQIASGATFRLSGTSGWPTGFVDTITAGSTVEYTGGAQTVFMPGNSQA